MIYGIEGAAALNADIVINVETEQSHVSYICRLDPTKAKHGPTDPPIEEQKVWSIIFYEQIQEENGIIRLNTKYPEGSTAYNFQVSNYNNYNYKFRL